MTDEPTGRGYPFALLSMNQARTTYGAVYQTAHEALPALNPVQLQVVVSLVVDTCPKCHAANSRCKCWNDE